MRKDRVAKAVRIVTDWIRRENYQRHGGATLRQDSKSKQWKVDPHCQRDDAACEMVCVYLEAIFRETCQSDNEHPIVAMVKAEETSRFWDMVEKTWNFHREAMGLD